MTDNNESIEMEDRMENKEDILFDVTTLKIGDIVNYFAHDNGNYFIEQGEVRSENIYKDGVEVHGEGWRQYVGKWFINKIIRNEKVIYEQQ